MKDKKEEKKGLGERITEAGQKIEDGSREMSKTGSSLTCGCISLVVLAVIVLVLVAVLGR